MLSITLNEIMNDDKQYWQNASSQYVEMLTAGAAVTRLCAAVTTSLPLNSFSSWLNI